MKSIYLSLALVFAAGCSSLPKEIQDKNERTADACFQAGRALDAKYGPRTGERFSYKRTVDPKWPARAHARRIEGCVGIVYDVTEAGEPVNIRVAVAEPQEYAFRESALYAFAQWEFQKKAATNQRMLIQWLLPPEPEKSASVSK